MRLVSVTHCQIHVCYDGQNLFKSSKAPRNEIFMSENPPFDHTTLRPWGESPLGDIFHCDFLREGDSTKSRNSLYFLEEFVFFAVFLSDINCACVKAIKLERRTFSRLVVGMAGIAKWLDHLSSKPPSDLSHEVQGENLPALCNYRQKIKDKRNHEMWSHRQEGPGSHCSISLPIFSGPFVLCT